MHIEYAQSIDARAMQRMREMTLLNALQQR
jgi:hypothetical protein